MNHKVLTAVTSVVLSLSFYLDQRDAQTSGQLRTPRFDERRQITDCSKISRFALMLMYEAQNMTD